MKKLITTLFIIGFTFIGQSTFAYSLPANPASILQVDNIASTTAQVVVGVGYDEIQTAVQNRAQVKIQWRPWMCGDDQIAGQACTMIYIQPFVTTLDYDSQGKLLPVVLTNLQPNTKYRVWLGYDNGVRCITAPCASDTFSPAVYSFTTLPKQEGSYPRLLSQKLKLGSRGTDVNILENFLSDNGYFVGPDGDMRKYVDSYFGTVTRTAVMKYQTDRELKGDGIVGIETRAIINQQMKAEASRVGTQI
jgi:hypothetical protein